VQLIGPAAASFSLCLLATFALRPLAIALDLIDRPGGRKTHKGDVPVVGGLAMLLGIMLGMGFVPLPDSTAAAFLAGCALLVTVGLIDDRFDLSPWARLPAQMAAAALLVGGSHVLVTTLGTPFGATEVTMSGFGAYLFTILITVAAINSFNMLDGMDGLAGAMAVVALAALTFLALAGGAVLTALTGLVVMGSVAAFLVSNVPLRFNRPVRCFMGDSGSTLLGFAVAWLCIRVSQEPVAAAAPVTMLWIVALPLYDFLWAITRRVLRGISPFKPDDGHLHHRLQRAGFGVRGAFAIFAILATMLAVFGITLERMGVSDSWSFTVLAVMGVVVVRLMYRAEWLWRLLPKATRPVFPPPPEAKA
jgi:UDP-GlcNAc:undecaprenyl-phosphate/decaprenyl-phosphate GlcNAc-1-phosphate transferase